jgi:hypothetical protein
MLSAGLSQPAAGGLVMLAGWLHCSHWVVLAKLHLGINSAKDSALTENGRVHQHQLQNSATAAGAV